MKFHIIPTLFDIFRFDVTQQTILTISIFADEITWPDGDDCLPASAVDLITGLLDRDPLKRLGTHGAIEVYEM